VKDEAENIFVKNFQTRVSSVKDLLHKADKTNLTEWKVDSGWQRTVRTEYQACSWDCSGVG